MKGIMDEMKLTTKLMRGVVAKIIKRIIKNKFGCDVKVDLNTFYVSYDENMATIHLDAAAQLDRANLENILKDADLL
jgi:hypothetical protein